MTHLAGRQKASRPFDDRPRLQARCLQTEAPQRDHRVGPERKPGPDLGDLRGLLEDRSLDADPSQCHRGGEPADAAADNQRANRRLPRLAAAGRTRHAHAAPANWRSKMYSKREMPILEQREISEEVPFFALTGVSACP
jgi:hypothetical protein